MEQGKKANAFTRQEIEQHLQSALTAAAPDIWSKLELQIQAEQEKDHRNRSAESQKRGNVIALHKSLRRIGAAAAACVCLTAFGGGYYHYQYLQVASQVEIDVNPSLKLSLNRKEKVIRAEALNEDGRALLDSSALTGQNVTTAVDQVVDSLVKQGYLNQERGECALLVSVSGKNPQKAEQLKTAISQDVEAALSEKEVHAVVYDQVIQVTEELEELADTYQVSLGKAEFVGQLIQENTALSQEQQDAYSRMMSQTMEELTREIGEKSYSLSANVTIIKTEPVPTRDRADASRGTPPDASQPLNEKTDITSAFSPPEIPAESEEALEEDEEQMEPLKDPEPLTEETEKARKAPEPESQAVDPPLEGAIETEPVLPSTEEGQGYQEQPGETSSIMEAQVGKDDSMMSVEVEEGSIYPPQEEELPKPVQEETEEETPQESKDRADDASQETIQLTPGTSEEPFQPEQGTEEEPSGSEPEMGKEEPSQPGQEPEAGAPSQPEQKPVTGDPSQSGQEPGAGESSQPGQEPGAEEEPSQSGHEPGVESSSQPQPGEEGLPAPSQNKDAEASSEQQDAADTPPPKDRQIIPAKAEEADDFGPGDVSDPLEEGMTITESGTVIIAGEAEEKEWREPVYASQMLSGFERSLLQKGPGMFFGRIAEDGQETLLRYGPGFAYIYEGDHYRGSNYTRIRIKPSKGKVYRVESAE